MVEVVAAIIRREGRFLLCQRPETKKRALLWEFPGGKVEPGESREEALVRECREELGVTLRVTAPFTEVFHRYPDLEIRLSVFDAELAGGEPQLLEHRAFRWITAEELDGFELCPADRPVAEKLKENAK